MKKIFAGLFILLCTVSLISCESKSKEQFGFFSHNGYSLKSFKNKDITYTEANNLIKTNTISTASATSTSNADESLTLTTAQINAIKAKYSSVKITTSFWDNDKQHEQYDVLNLSQIEQMLLSNSQSIGSGVSINNIALTDSLLETYNQSDLDFKASANYNDAPFKDKYSYHTQNDNFVLRINDYSENIETITGTATTEIHQTEALYNEYNLLTNYQASFGFRYSSINGTQDIGTVLEISFEWIVKT